MVVFGQMQFNRAKWLYSGKSSLIGQSGCIRAKRLYLDESGCIRAKWLYSGEMVVFWQKMLYSEKKDCIRAKWLFSGRSCCVRVKSYLVNSGCILEK